MGKSGGRSRGGGEIEVSVSYSDASVAEQASRKEMSTTRVSVQSASGARSAVAAVGFLTGGSGDGRRNPSVRV